MITNADIAVWVLAGIPVLLFLIAGIKLQFRLTTIENEYHYALSLDNNMDLDWTDKTLTLGLKFSNALNKPIEYEFMANKTYMEIKDMPRVTLQSNDRGIISPLKTDIYILPEIVAPEYYPCEGTLHYELVYGYPGKPLFRQVKEFNLKLNRVFSPQKEVRIVAKSILDEDKPIKK